MREEVKSKVEKLCYKSAILKYGGKLYQVERYKLTWDKLAIIATPKTLVIQANNIDQFLNEVELVSQSPLASKKPHVTEKFELQTDDFGAYNKLNSGLLKAFETVQNDEAFIPKAKQMCDIAQQIVNLEKTKLEILKMTR